MRIVRGLCLFFPLMLILWGCDSSSNIKNPNDSYFLKFYGGEGDQRGVDFVTLPDGSFILFGTSTPTGKLSQWYFVRADKKGNIVWERQFGDPAVEEDARSIKLTNDNRLVAVGNYLKAPGDRDIRIMTLSLDGVPLDSAFINIRDVNGNPTTADEDALSVTQTNDGFIIAGWTTYLFLKAPVFGRTDIRDALKVRLYDDLSVYPNSWLQTYGYYADDVSQEIFQLPSGLFYGFGYSNRDYLGNMANYNFWVHPLSTTGDFNNQELTPPPGTPSDHEKLSSVVSAPSSSGSGYFLAGITTNSAGSSDVYVTKLRSSLTFNAADYQFQKPLSIKLGSNVSENTSVAASASSGTFYVLANENSANNNQNWVLTKINSDGSTVWSLPIVFGGEGLDICGGVKELPDGRIALVGTMQTGKPGAGELKMTLIKVNQEGKFLE